MPSVLFCGNILDKECYLISMETDSAWHTRKTLLQKIRDRDDNLAWTDFVYYYRGFIYNIVRKMGLSHHDSLEVVQLVMLKSWKSLPDFEYDPAKGRFRGWLCRITGNTARNYIRDEKSRFVPADAEEIERLSAKLDRFTEPEIDKLSEEEWEKYLPELAWKNVQKDFEKNVRICFEKTKDGIPIKEISNLLGITESSVYVYKKRVVDKLKVEIKRLRQELD